VLRYLDQVCGAHWACIGPEGYHHGVVWYVVSLQFVWEKGGVFQVGVSCYMGVITVLGTR
jgi:hypothetical protein